MTPHLLRYQGLAVRQRALADGFVLDALYMGHPRLLQRWSTAATHFVIGVLLCL